MAPRQHEILDGVFLLFEVSLLRKQNSRQHASPSLHST
jgi:hypothetical protein